MNRCGTSWRSVLAGDGSTLADTAFHDVEEICNYIALDKPEAAQRIAQRIYAAAGSLGYMPYQGRLKDRTDLRELVIAPFPYIIRYRVKNYVLMARVLHGARDVAP